MARGLKKKKKKKKKGKEREMLNAIRFAVAGDYEARRVS